MDRHVVLVHQYAICGAQRWSLPEVVAHILSDGSMYHLGTAWWARDDSWGEGLSLYLDLCKEGGHRFWIESLHV